MSDNAVALSVGLYWDLNGRYKKNMFEYRTEKKADCADTFWRLKAAVDGVVHSKHEGGECWS